MPQSNQEWDPQADSDRRFPLWTILPWTLLAAALLLLLPRVFHSSSAAGTAAPPPVVSPASPAARQTPGAAPSAAATPATAPAAAVSSLPPAVPASAAPASAAPTPLTVTLDSANRGKHVPVGKPVMISAYASLPPGQSATLAISYSKGGGSRTLLSLAQGSLSSAAWTPAAPGRYKFTASALDSRKDGVFSHSLVISVDAPPQPAPASVAAVRPAHPAPVPAASRLTASKPSKPAAPKPPRPVPAHSSPAHSSPAHSSPYHVAAASFSYRPVAETLAGALRRRGFHAFVRASSQRQGNRTYRVETGDFAQLTAAQKQVSLLKRDGYPAFLFRAH